MANFDEEDDYEDVAPVSSGRGLSAPAQSYDESDSDEEDDQDSSASSVAPASSKDDESNDSDEPEYSSSGRAPSSPPDASTLALAPLVPNQSSSPLDPTDKLSAMKAYLEPRYDPGVQAAMAESKRQNMISNIGSALDTIATANAVAHGGRGSDQGFWQGVKDQGQQGVNTALKNFAQKNEIQMQTAKAVMEKGDFDQRQKAAQFVNDQRDPSSQVSKNAQASFATLFKNDPKLASLDLSTYSANDIADLSKNAETKEKLADAKSNRMLQIASRQDILADRRDQKDKQIAINDSTALAKDLDTQSTTSRSNIGMAQNKINSADRLMAFAHVDPKELDAAQKDPQARAALIGKLNNLPPQQYAEIVSGLMTQVSNGGGSLGQLEHLKANTLEETKAKIMQYVSSDPTGANLGAIIYPNLMTLKNERDTSQNIVDDHNKKLMAKHPYAFSNPVTKSNSEAMLQAFAKPSVSDDASGAAPVAGWAHPQAQDAKQWAMANPNDPRSIKILQNLGMMNASNNIGGVTSGSK